jgi:hypothetical protein
MNYSDNNMINQLTSKIFHDIGNAIVPLNFFIELNRDDPNNLDFQELISVNKQILLNFNILKYAFLPDEYGEKALVDLEEYFNDKNKKVKFNIDHIAFDQNYFVIMVHILMLLNNILHNNAEILVSYHDESLNFHCKDSALEKEKLKIFNNLNVENNVNVFYIKSFLEKLKINLSYKFISDSEFLIETI